MAQTVYTNGAPGEMGEIIDFINYIFSQTRVPHDFKALLPKVYGDDAPAGGEAFHFLAKQQNKIVGCVANRLTTLHFGDSQLYCGYVGSVSVHPYHRGEGHMKKLMSNVICDAKAHGLDMLILGGQRQRYGYFGFEPAGLKYSFRVTKTNLRHALNDLDASAFTLRPMTESDTPAAMALWQRQKMRAERNASGFIRELRSWNQTPLALEFEGAFKGYIAGNELVLESEELLPYAIKSLFSYTNEPQITFEAPLHDKARAKYLAALCEGMSLVQVGLVHVLSWPRVLKTLIEFKHRYVSPVRDARAFIDIAQDGAFEINVENGKADVTPLKLAPADALRLTHSEAQRLFFGIPAMLSPENAFEESLTGLPFYMSEQDAF